MILFLALLAFWMETAGAAGAAAPVRLFGTVEIRRPLTTLPDWLKVIERDGRHPIFTSGSKLNAGTTWDELKTRAEPLSPLDRLKLVNSFWNRWPYRQDSALYGKADYWAAPCEFRKNSGDCEDYSIVKYFTLKNLGVSPDDMRIVVGMETIRNIAHAVLVVYLDGETYVLDNLSNNLLSHTRYRNFEPRYSVNEKNRWAHMKTKK